MRCTPWLWTAMAVLGSTLAGGRVAAQQQGQSPAPVDRTSAERMAEEGRTLLEKARSSPEGLAVRVLERYGGHFTLLTARLQTGTAEQHARASDLFLVVEGEATLVSGGTIVDPRTASDETTGTRVSGGTSTPMRKGDVLHIAPGVPHQITIAPGAHLVYYVVKVAAPPA